MDWISIRTNEPKTGQVIWGKDKNGDAVLGTFGRTAYSNILLNKKGKVVLIDSLKFWATYDVIF